MYPFFIFVIMEINQYLDSTYLKTPEQSGLTEEQTFEKVRELTDEAIATAQTSDSVLLGAVGGNVGNSKWYDVAPNLRPEAGLLKIRKELELFAFSSKEKVNRPPRL